jgi:hypothetical protein
MNETPQVVIVMARCSSTRGAFGIRMEQMHGHWTATWSFALKEAAAAREGYDRTRLAGPFGATDEYPGCPGCRLMGWAQCGRCSRLSCYDGHATSHTCPWCGTQLQMEGTIDRIDAGRDA